jgi:GYD domain
MPLYLSRFSYTPETWAKLIGNPEDRRKAAESYIESVGGKLHGFWYAFGSHDGYTLWRPPTTCPWPRSRWRSAGAVRSARSKRPSS